MADRRQKQKKPKTSPRKNQNFRKFSRDNINTTLKEDIELKEKYNEIVKGKVLASKRILHKNKETAELKFNNFSLFSKSSEDREKDEKFFEESKDLKSIEENLANNSIDRAEKSGNKHSATFRLTKEGLNDLGLDVGRNGKLTGTLNVEEVQKRMKKISEDGSLYARNLVDICLAKSESASVFEEPTEDSTQPTPSDDTPPTPSTDDQINDLVMNQISNQLYLTKSPEDSLKISNLSDESNVNQIDSLNSSASIINNPSIHDFFSIKIAFESVWTEIFDDKLKNLGKRLYDEWITSHPVTNDEEFQPVTSAEELRGLLDHIREINDSVTGQDPRFETVSEVMGGISRTQWAALEESAKNSLTALATRIKILESLPFTNTDDLRQQMLDILNSATLNVSRLEKLLRDIEKRLSEPYRFTLFAPNSINFGLFINYRQTWIPENFQVGDLVSTIPLAPKEERTFSQKSIIKKSRNEKETEDSLEVIKRDSSSTSKADKEIVDKAASSTNFTVTSGGGFSMPAFNANVSTSLSNNSSNESSQTKKRFHESVVKESEEYKHNHKIEIETKSSEEIEETTSGKILNVNDAITLTCLFYQLQRVYHVTEKLHKVTPVIFVANEVPQPHQIDEEWILGYDWIIRRVLLDDSFIPALDYIKNDFTSSQVSLEVLRGNLERQQRITEKIGQQLGIHTTSVRNTFQQYQDLSEIDLDELSDGTTLSHWLNIIRLRKKHEELEEDVMEMYEFLKREEAEMRARMAKEVAELNRISDKYAEAIKDHFGKLTEIDRLRIHIKENILYYMQAIWAHEIPDQRYFRLHNIEVPIDFKAKSNTLTAAVVGEYQVVSDLNKPKPTFGSITGAVSLGDFEVKIPLPPPNPLTTEKRTLAEVADLDNLLGFKGNYMIFPLRNSSYITDYMLQDFVNESYGGLFDPDELSNYSKEDIIKVIECLKSQPNPIPDEVKTNLLELLEEKILEPVEDKRIIVPTDSLLIEAIPGSNSLLEEFKLKHRAIDVQKVMAETRGMELNNIRAAARILKNDYEDPEIDKQIFVKGEKINPVIDVDDDTPDGG